jgi:hypothetical protein
VCTTCTYGAVIDHAALRAPQLGVNEPAIRAGDLADACLD